MDKIRYSILIPAYQASSTIERCLDSILNQKANYEVIVLNDGSKDNLDEVLDKYKSKIKYYKQENKGIAETRNELIKKASGEYLTFVDSDDYVKPNFFEIIDREIDKNQNLDVVSFGIEVVDEEENVLSYMAKPEVKNNSNGEEVFKLFVENKATFDTPVGYIYSKKYFLSNKFSYAKGHNHEDFGLTPLVIVKAKNMISIKDDLYCYVQTTSSITRGNSKEKIRKNAYDILYHFDNLKNIMDNDTKISKECKKYFYAFLANSAILQLNTLTGNDYKEFKRELKRRKVTKYLLNDTLKRKLKKVILKLKISM